MSIMPSVISRLFSIVTGVAATNLTISPVATTPLCYMSNVADPLTPGSVGAPVAEIRRVAWPLSSPPVNVPLTINGEEPVGSPEVICMTGCAMPPCLPIHTCPPPDLWWSAVFDRGVVKVAQGELLRLPDALTPPPPVMAFLWDNFVPLPSPSPTPSASPLPSACPSFAVSASQATPSSGYIAAAVFAGILSICVALLVYCVIMLYRYTQCPYCLKIQRAGSPVLAHLKECPEHLKQFSPLTPVITIAAPPSAPVTQLVFARSSRLVRPVAVAAEKAPLGLDRADSDEVEVVLEANEAKNAVPN